MAKSQVKKDSLSAYMKRTREDLGLSQQDVSRKLGFSSPQFISNWERGLANPPTKSLIRLKGLYKLDVNYVVELIVDNTREKLHRAFRIR